MCGEETGKPVSSFARWPGPYAVADDVDANGPEGWEDWETRYDDDLPDFEFDEDDDDWDEEDWFEDDDDWINDPLLSLEDAIMLMDEDSLLEWLLEEETEFAWRRGDACGESAYLDDEVA